ncbi:hypothetical protein I350_01581 [Cryptococcus amylolentus CBS 6273]|uniref:Cytochrome P450 n=1 Tax=Cryptococcus amylolentus CBS 6273 TaxID=1296118 RepID=A0A1E3KCZ8_9TREE|nr:hypothetical protein I350_01581 [Cryptococcus amylolentus CBS 6273]
MGIPIRPLTVCESLGLALLAFVVWAVHIFLYKPLTSPLRHLPCPEGGWAVGGHIDHILDLGSEVPNQWIDELGPTFMVRGFFAVHHRIFTVDPRALDHVLQNTDVYTKPDILRSLVKRYMKNGLIVAEGTRHRIQRKVTQKLFSTVSTRAMGVLVQDKSNQLREILRHLCASPATSTPFSQANPTLPAVTRQVDVYSSASRCMFDVIGAVAVDSVNPPFNAAGDYTSFGAHLFHKYEKMQLLCEGAMGLRMFFSLYFPWIDSIWPSENTKRVNDGMGSLLDFAKHQMAERRAELEAMNGKKGDVAERRDLLTLMLKHNMMKNLSPTDKLRDDEISGQLSTFMFAGSETTAGTISFGLYDLARHSEIQAKLRAEILECAETFTSEQLDELPYLDAVVKEIMRCNPSLPGTVRMATRDDMIPLAVPVKLSDERVVSEIRIRKGQLIHVPIDHLHACTHIWGPTANEFDPSRFLDAPSTYPSSTPTTPSFPPDAGPVLSSRRTSVPSIVPAGPGIWPNFMTFIDGPRRCIGYKLAVMEIKMVLFTLLREFEVEPVKGIRIGRWNMMSNRPYVSGTLMSEGSRLPLNFRLYKGENENVAQDAKL